MTLPIRFVRRTAALVLAVALSLSAGLAFAETEEEILAKRTQWQERYRVALGNREILKDNIAKLRKNYAQAQRRNYPRGGAREAFLTQAQEQEVLLEETEQEIESIREEARAASIPPGWLAEVEDESFERPSQPAAPSSDEEEVDREGRNPIYFDDDDDA
ncbi:MAG: hypothetical protein NXI30_06370 [bacterium]|nr:hypothetical protein [bacterium]